MCSKSLQGVDFKISGFYTDKFGCLGETKSTEEELFVCVWVGSLINCENPFEDVSEHNFAPSEV